LKPSHSIDSLVRSNDERPARRVPAWLIPAAIFAGFLLLFAVLFGDRLLPGKPVDVAIVLATLPTSHAPAASPSQGSVQFQASGWIEPDPLPIRASALVDGVIDHVKVLEGQQVSRGDVIAGLIDADAMLELEAARNEHRKWVSAKAAHVAGIESARMKLKAAEAEVDSAETQREEALDRLTRMKDLSRQVVPESELIAARLRLAREESLAAAALAGKGELEAEVTRLELETRVKEDEIAAAAVAVKQAELALSRTRIVAPIDGRILRLMAAPGQKKMQSDNDAESSTVAILYDPQKLQVRVDVPLADAAGLQLGQRVRIHCSLLPERGFDGEVTRISGEADLQRNTLQAKVRIENPAEQLRPEMLCRVEFMDAHSAPASGSSVGKASSGSLAMWIPESALADNAVWVVDPETRRATKRPIQATQIRQEEHRRILEGLRPGEWVVIRPSGLQEGQRVKPRILSTP
jgi:RND family efflux transporter MFP subunit